MAQQVLTAFQESTETWQKVPDIFSQAQSLQTKVSVDRPFLPPIFFSPPLEKSRS